MCSCGKEPETTLHYLLRCDLYSIYRLELLNDICALNGSLENSSEEKLLKILHYGAEDFSSQMNYEILKCTIKFIKKQIALVALYFFPSFLSFFFTLTKYLAFNIFSMSLMFYVQSLYRIYSKRYMSSVSFVSCLILFYLLLFLIYL